MTENQTPDEQPTPDVTPAEPEMPPGMTPEQMKALKDKLREFASGRGTTASGSEAPAEGAKEDPRAGLTMTGAEVDWSEYDLDYNLAHLYPRATFRETGQGPKWVAVLDEFYSIELSFGQHGKRTKDGIPINLGEYISEMVNSPEGWRIAALLPASMGRGGVILQKKTPIVLPDPKQLQKTEEVAVPTDTELKKAEDAALGWMQGEGLTTEPEGETMKDTEPKGLTRAIERDTPEFEQAAAEMAAEAETGVPRGQIARQALDLNRESSVILPKGEQPENVPYNTNPANTVIAGGMSAAEAALEALGKEDFETPTE